MLSLISSAAFEEFVALANEISRTNMDTIKTGRKRFFFMDIGVFRLLEAQISEEKMVQKKNRDNAKKTL